MTDTFTATRDQLVDTIACLKVNVATSGPAKGMINAESMADAIIEGLGASTAAGAPANGPDPVTAGGQDHGPPELWWLRERADELGIPAELATDWRGTYAYVCGYQTGEEIGPGWREAEEQLEAAAGLLRTLGHLAGAPEGSPS